MRGVEAEGEAIPSRAPTPSPPGRSPCRGSWSGTRSASSKTPPPPSARSCSSSSSPTLGSRRGVDELRCLSLLARTCSSVLLVQGESARQRHVPVGRQLARRLERHIQRTRPGTGPGGTEGCFLGLRRGSRPGAYQPRTPNGVAQVVRYLGQRAVRRQTVPPNTSGTPLARRRTGRESGQSRYPRSWDTVSWR